MTESPASAVPNGIHVRRYVSSDIPGIIKLAQEAHGDAVPAFSKKRLSFILNNNLNNALMYSGVLVDHGEVVGTLIGTLVSTLDSDEKVTQDWIFHIEDEYAEYKDMMLEDYKKWAELRQAHYKEPTGA